MWRTRRTPSPCRHQYHLDQQTFGVEFGTGHLNRTNAEAVRDLKHFRAFAERGPRASGEAVAHAPRSEASDEPLGPTSEDEPAAPDAGGDYGRTSLADMSTPIEADLFHERLHRNPARDDRAGDHRRSTGPRRLPRLTRRGRARQARGAIRDRIMTLARAAIYDTQEEDNAAFLWPDNVAISTSSDDIRPLEDIALPELAAALRSCTDEDPAAAASAGFGHPSPERRRPRSPPPRYVRDRAFTMTASA
jgi:hypothetical protein